MERKPDSMLRVSVDAVSFFRAWLVFLRPYHGLTDRQIDIAAALLRHRHSLSSVISDEVVLNEMLFADSVRNKILGECNLNIGHYQVILGELRKHKFIIDGCINQRYIPDLRDGAGSFLLAVNFQFS